MRTFVKIILFIFYFLLSSNLYCQIAKDFKIDTIIDFGIVNYDTVKTNKDGLHRHLYDRTRKIKIPIINNSKTDIKIKGVKDQHFEFCLNYEFTESMIKPGDTGLISIECLNCMEDYENLLEINTTLNSSQYFYIKGKFEIMPHILELDNYYPQIKGSKVFGRLYEKEDTLIFLEVHNVSENETLIIGDFEAETPLSILDTSLSLKPGERKKIRIFVHPLIPFDVHDNYYQCFPKISFTSSGYYHENIIVQYDMNIFRNRESIYITQMKSNKDNSQSVMPVPSEHYPATSFFLTNRFYYIYPNPENLVVSTTAPFSVYKYTKGDSIFFNISIDPLFNDTLSIEHFLDNYKTVRTLIIDTSTNKILHTIEQKFEVLPALALKYNFEKETDTLVSARFCLGWKTEAGQMISRPIREHFSAHITDSIGNFVYFDSFSKKTAFFDGWNDCQNCNCNKILFNKSDINKALHVKIDNFNYFFHDSAINYVYIKRQLYPLIKPVYVFVIKPEVE